MNKRWLNWSTNDKSNWLKLRSFLKENNIKYEPSECGNSVHVELFVDSEEEEKVNSFLDRIL